MIQRNYHSIWIIGSRHNTELVSNIFSNRVISIYNSDAEFIDEGSIVLRIFSLAFVTIGIQMILTFFFQGIGKGIASIVLASARQVIFLLPAMLVIPLWFGLTGVWVAFPLTDIFAFVLAIIWTAIEFKRQQIRFNFGQIFD